jgi:hypothetical protein
MQEITTHHAIVAGLIFAAILIAGQVVRFGMLLQRRSKIKAYERFIYTTFTQYRRQTPTLILRIQDGNILRYNDLLKQCRFLALFFKEMDYLVEPPVEVADLSLMNNL